MQGTGDRTGVSGGEIVAMMQSAEPWRGYDSIAAIGVLHCNTTSRRSLCRLRIARSLAHPTQYRTLRDRSQAFSVPHECAARPRFGSQRPCGRLARTIPMSRKPCPIQLEPSPMPENDRLRLEENQWPPPAWPEQVQQNPKQSVRGCESRRRTLQFQNGELLPKSQVFQE